MQNSEQISAQQSGLASGYSRHTMIGIALVLVSSIAFSSKAIMVKLAYAYPVDAATLIALRMAFSVPFFVGMIVWLRLKGVIKPLSLHDMAMLLFIGIVTGYGSMWLNFAGLETVSAGLERVILFLYPTIVILLNAAIHKHKITKYEVIALFASYAGVLLVVGHDMQSAAGGTASIIWGAGLIFGSAVTYAVYLVLSGRLIPKYGALLYTAYGMVVMSVTSATHFALTESFDAAIHLPIQVYGFSLLMALIATVIPALCLNIGIHRLGSNTASLLSTIGPVSTIYLAWVFLGESVTCLQMMGTALVVLGVLVISLKR